MGLFELFIIAVGLSMDAFAVSICKGLSMPKASFKAAATVGLYFGVFQALMPLLGYGLASRFTKYIETYDHWVAFILLSFIGGNMIREAIRGMGCKCEEESVDPGLSVKKMLPMAIATSIDALAAGVSFAFLQVRIAPAVAFIGVVTLGFSMLGVKIGNVFGTRFKAKAELAGGLILVIMGIKILLEHLNVF